MNSFLRAVHPFRTETDDLVTAQRLEKWLKAATDQAAQDQTINLYGTDSRRSRYVLDWRGADETDLHALRR